jgi:hypothetical protein
MPTLRAPISFLTDLANSVAKYGHAPRLTVRVIGAADAVGSPSAGDTVSVPAGLPQRSSLAAVIVPASQVLTVPNPDGGNIPAASLIGTLILESGRSISVNSDFVTNAQQHDTANELAALGWVNYTPGGNVLPAPVS